MTSTDAVSWPKILRLRATLESVRAEVKALTPDARSLERLAMIHNRLEAELAEAVGADLELELDELSACCRDNPSPTEDEIKVAQAQLAGWIQGLLNGVVMTEVQAGVAPPAIADEQASQVDQGTYNPSGYV